MNIPFKIVNPLRSVKKRITSILFIKQYCYIQI